MCPMAMGRFGRSFSALRSTGPAAPALYTLSLHDALPISAVVDVGGGAHPFAQRAVRPEDRHCARHRPAILSVYGAHALLAFVGRSEEHTSELQSRENLVCRLLLEKKKKKRM